MKHCRIFLAWLLIILTAEAALSAAAAEPQADLLTLYPIQSVPFSYAATGSKNSNVDHITVPFSCGFFLQDAREFSPELARLGAALSMSAYDWSYISRALTSMGFSVDSAWSATYDRDMTVFDNHYVAYCVGTQTVSGPEEDYIVYCVPVRGTMEQEWYSDFVLGTGDTHEGFRIAAEEVYESLTGCMAEDDFPADRTVVFLTGHSRGAAVSNLVAGWLTKGSDNPERIFSYNYACPNVSTKADTSLLNIYNFNNPGDLIPLLPLDGWGYKRNGRTYSTIDEITRSNLEQQFMRVVGENFSCEPNPDGYTTVLSTLFPKRKDYEAPAVQLVLNLAAWGLGKGPDSELPELFVKSGVEAGKYALDDLRSTTAEIWAQTKAGELVQACTTLIEFVEQHANAVPTMTPEEFATFLEENRLTIGHIEEITGIEITSQTDFLSSKTHLTDTKDVTEAIAAAILDLATLFWDENGLILNKVTHGHTGVTYVLWINSLLYGYKGWYGYTAEDSPALEADPNGELLDTKNKFFTNHSGNPSLYVSMGDFCFENCTGLASLTLPWSLRYLGERLCCKATGLEGAVVIPDGVTAISNQAFYMCEGITDVSLPASISFSSLSGGVNGNADAFTGCTGITRVRLTGTGPMAKHNHACTPWGRGSAAGNDVTVEIAEGVTSISNDAFSFCENIIRITIPESVTTIGSGAFASCTRLEQADLPSALTSIGEKAFLNCYALRASSLPGTVGFVPDSLYYNCRSLEQVTLGSGLTRIGESAFSGCSSLRELTIPDTVTAVRNYAFNNCSSITHLTMPITFQIINSYSQNNGIFNGCTGITRVTLTGSGDQAQCDGVCAPWRKASDAGSRVTVEIGEGVTSIYPMAFYECKNLIAVRIPDSVTSVGSSAFYGCSGLEQVFYYGSEAQWKDMQIAQYNDPLLNALIYFNSRYLQAGAIGESKALLWKYEGDTGTLTVSGAAAEETPLFAAVYDGGKFVELRIFTSAREAETFMGQFDRLKLFWLGEGWLPLWDSTDVMLP